MKQALFVCASTFVLLILLFYLVKYQVALELRYRVWNAGGWEIVEVKGYNEGGPWGSEESWPNYSVTGVVLAAKEQPDAVIELSLGDKETLYEGEPIRVHRMNALRLDPYDPQLLNDPRLNDQQRYYLQYFSASLDIRDRGPLGHLFPHPIRNLDDLKVHYDEVYAVFSSFAGKGSK
jgi:hypothetical protein